MESKNLKEVKNQFIQKSYLLAGQILCSLKRYDLNNFDFHFAEPVKGNGSKSSVGKKSWIDRKANLACSRYLTAKYYGLQEKERREFLNRRIWGGSTGEAWHSQVDKVYKSSNEFAEKRKSLIEDVLSIPPDEYDGIIEIGTGTGWFLNILSQKLGHNVELTGLDLSQKIVDKAREAYRGRKNLNFQCCDLGTFAQSHSLKKKIIIACFVLEYFSNKELADFSGLLKEHAPCRLVMIERVDRNQENKAETVSIGDFSYSHDYERIFEKQGLLKVSAHKRPGDNSSAYFNLTASFKA